MNLPENDKKHIEKNKRILYKYSAKLASLYEHCYASAIDTALGKCDDGIYFV